MATTISHPAGLDKPKIITERTAGDNKVVTNGHTNGLTNGHHDDSEISDDDFAVLSLRNLLFDICNHEGRGGHGGSAIGMAAIGVALYKYTMRYNPSNTEWFDRDRFVLSNGSYISVATSIDRPV